MGVQEVNEIANDSLSDVSTGRSVFDKILDATGWIIGGILILMTLNISVSVVSRYFFSNPLAPLFEWTEYGVMALPILVAALLARDGEHIHLDLLDQLVSEKILRNLDVFVAIFVLIVAAILTWAGLTVTWSDLSTRATTNTFLGLARWPFIGVISFGFALLFLEQIRRIVNMARKRF